jgi:hypothetical protein
VARAPKRYIKNIDTGHCYPYSDTLAKRSYMVECTREGDLLVGGKKAFIQEVSLNVKKEEPKEEEPAKGRRQASTRVSEAKEKKAAKKTPEED